MSGVNGILLVDKPVGMTSADVIRSLKKILAKKTKIGHLGTLDPFASGLLPVCIGSGTKIAQFLMAEKKGYTGTIRLGVQTDTQDVTGTVSRTAPVPEYSPDVLRELEHRFCGDILQTPPMYSAIKKNGVPLYKLAHQGLVVERQPRPAVIHHLSLEVQGQHTLGFSVSCSKGTYVRTLAADLGTALGCGGHLLSLKRTAFGPFGLADSLPLTTVLEGPERLKADLLSPSEALSHYRTIEVSPAVASSLHRGQQAPLRDMPPASAPHERIQLVTPDGTLVAVAQHHPAGWRLARVVQALQCENSVLESPPA